MSAEEYAFDLGGYSRPITTSSPAAQIWFDRGLNWNFGYNHEEALACFAKALEHDPRCAMASWGIAYVVGPNYNKPWELFPAADVRDTLRRSREATAAAKTNMTGASEVEQALISALDYRYQPEAAIPNMSTWNDAYCSAMRDVYKLHPDDLDVAALFAEAMMNRTPWNMWDLKTGAPTVGADSQECREVLETAIQQVRLRGEPPHPGVWHMYVHLMEMSQTPEVALPVGDELRRLVPDSGHLAHMPTHLDVLCGDYRSAVEWNDIGIATDVKYWEYAGAENFYTLYRAHNYHFKMYSAMLLGQFGPAMEAATTMLDTIPEELVRLEEPPMADLLEAYLADRTHALVRFGRWPELAETPLPTDRKLYAVTTAINLYGKGIGHAALKQHDEAARAAERFEDAVTAVPTTRLVHVVECHSVLAIAREVMTGEIEYHKGNFETAFAHLRRAVALEDALPYDEPWGWMMPSRHALGALLLEQGQTEEAIHAYEADLGLNDTVIRSNRHPNNVWALQGLHNAYTQVGRRADARMLEPLLATALALADNSVATSRASCFCAGR